MALFHDSAIAGASGNQGGGVGYQISRSLRFNSSDSAYLSRVVGGSATTFTISCWVKLGKLTGLQTLFGFGADTYSDTLFLTGDGRVSLYNGSSTGHTYSTALLRDPSAWYHFLVKVTSGNPVLYVNGSLFVSASGYNWQMHGTNNRIGAFNESGTPQYFFDGYIADFYCIENQALDPSSFTEVSATTGQLIPKAYTGSFGTNGFWLKFSDNSAATATTLGKDYSSNGNNWTPNNLSVTAGAGNDSLTDSPTSYGSDTGAGGEVRGNYSTLNPLQNATSDTFSNGNLQVVTAASGNYGTHTSTIATPLSGKWYAELTIDAADGLYTTVGLVAANSTFSSTSWPGALNGVCYAAFNGNSYVDTVSNAYGSIFGYPNDVVGIAYDADNGTVKFYLNGVSQGTISNVPVRPYYFGASDYWGVRSCTYTWNFGQRAWTYPANASGFKALCDTNLPAPVVAKSSTVMDVKLYTGNGSTQTISGLGFSPDLVWIKQRSGAQYHTLQDTIRGATNDLYSNATDAESTYAQSLNAFNSDGFTVGSLNWVNQNSQTYVAWTWDAGSSTVTNTAGSITSQVRANPSAGFSIVTFTGNGTLNATVGHGLGVTPAFIIQKARTQGNYWAVYHSSLAGGTFLRLDQTLAAMSETNYWRGYSSTTLTLAGQGSTLNSVNNNGIDYVAYCFAPVAGYSSFGSYTGNGSADGPFVYTGFRPKFVLIKGSSFVSNWNLLDGVRDSYNVADKILRPNLSNAELNSISAGSGFAADFLSNGFKLRASLGDSNSNAETFVWAAFAESPFAYSRAR